MTPSSPLYHTLVLIGCGNMGFAMLKRWVEQGAAKHFYVVEANEARHGDIAALGEAVTVSSHYNGEALGAGDAMLVAIKPQMAAEALPAYAPILGEAVLLSIMAGINCAQLEGWMGNEAKVVRIMPNLPAMIGEGASGCCGNATIARKDQENALALCELVGRALWLDEEEQMHALTALSGSGPAYVFHMIEALTQAGIKEGLNSDISEQLALATVQGAALLANQEYPQRKAAELREAVTSKGGTTQAALEVLMDNGRYRQLMEEALHAAAQQSVHLMSDNS